MQFLIYARESITGHVNLTLICPKDGTLIKEYMNVPAEGSVLQENCPKCGTPGQLAD
jgi:hypothetical protein